MRDKIEVLKGILDCGIIAVIRAPDIERALKYGVATSALNYSCPGDINWCTLEEVEKLITARGSRKISC